MTADGGLLHEEDGGTGLLARNHRARRREDDDACRAEHVVGRRIDGSIDHDFYIARARDLRAAEIVRLIRSLIAGLTRRRSG